MFKQRLLTTLVLIPLVLWAIYYGNIWLLSGVVLMLMMGLGYEWINLIPLKVVLHQCIFMLLLLLALLHSLFFRGWYLELIWPIWGLLVWAILTYPASERYWGSPVVVAGLGLYSLSLALSCLTSLLLQEHGRLMLIYLLFLVWAVDIGAYVVGKPWGHHKLIKLVSPGKSWEGTLGGFSLGLLIAVLGYFYVVPQSAMTWFFSAILVMVMSMFGDLSISMFKRRCHLKDTGCLIPGHGGLLDRLDSMIVALPFFYSVYPAQFQ